MFKTTLATAVAAMLMLTATVSADDRQTMFSADRNADHANRSLEIAPNGGLEEKRADEEEKTTSLWFNNGFCAPCQPRVRPVNYNCVNGYCAPAPVYQQYQAPAYTPVYQAPVYQPQPIAAPNYYQQPAPMYPHPVAYPQANPGFAPQPIGFQQPQQVPNTYPVNYTAPAGQPLNPYYP